MRIMVFSRGPGLYSTRRLVEAGEQRGHDMEIVDHGLCSGLLEGKKSTLLHNGSTLRSPDLAIARIGANMTGRGVSIIRQLDALGVPHLMTSEALLLARDKMSCLQRLAELNIDIPRTVLCYSTFEARRIARRMGPFPIVVKLLESTHGIGVALAHNMRELERLAEGFLQMQDRFLLQEYIRESGGNDIRAFVVGGEIVASMQRTAAEGEFRANIHRGATASKYTLSEQEVDIVLKTATAIGVEVAGIDLISSKRGPLVMEVNASPGLEGIEGATGVDIAGAIIAYAETKL